jgi:heme/copper-type cytochrome/quinol oxidase subunit 1
MSTTDISTESLATPAATAGTGGAVATLAAWVTSADSKVTGAKLIGTSLTALAVTAVMGTLLGLERVDGKDTLFNADALLQMFVAFRIGLVFGALVPLLLGIAVAIVPLQVGARSLAFPRLALAGFWTWLGGLVVVVVSLATNGGPGGGNHQMVDLFLAGLALLIAGVGAIAVALATTILTTRAPGMRLERVPFFSWSVLVAAIGLLVMLPVLFGVLIYLFVDHRHARLLFGGNIGVGSWISFALTQPATYLFALPAIGAFAELVPVTFGKRMPMRGVVYGGLGLVGVAALSGATQQAIHNVPWTGQAGTKFQSLLTYAIFTLLPLLGALVVLAMGALAAKPDRSGARLKITAPFLFTFFGFGMILVGMLGGALLPIEDAGLQGTVFEEATLVYVVYGAALAALGGIAWWLPKWTGRAVPDVPAMGLALLGLLATVLASFPYYIAGFADQPASSGTYDYSGPSALWNVLVMVGHVLMILTVLAFVGLAFRPAAGAPAVGDDPWRAQTLEWTTTSPAPLDNFVEVPTVMSPEPALDRHGEPSESSSERTIRHGEGERQGPDGALR